MDVTKIPKIMRANGLFKGAALLEKWFAAPPFEKKTGGPNNFGVPELSVITMPFALGFQRTQAIFEVMVSEQVWFNQNAQPIMKAKVRQIVAASSGAMQIDLANRPATELHELHVNFSRVNMNATDPLDDLSAALGNFALYVFPLKISVDTPTRTATLQQVGFHVYDSFDFNGNQALGYWRDSDNSISRLPPPGTDPVSNEDFRIWRRDNGRGGDFAIYSDILAFELPSPLKIALGS